MIKYPVIPSGSGHFTRQCTKKVVGLGLGGKQTADFHEGHSRGEARPRGLLLDHFVKALPVLRRGALSTGELEQSVSNCLIVKLVQKDGRNTRVSQHPNAGADPPPPWAEQTLGQCRHSLLSHKRRHNPLSTLAAKPAQSTLGCTAPKKHQISEGKL